MALFSHVNHTHELNFVSSFFKVYYYIAKCKTWQFSATIGSWYQLLYSLAGGRFQTDQKPSPEEHQQRYNNQKTNDCLCLLCPLTDVVTCCRLRRKLSGSGLLGLWAAAWTRVDASSDRDHELLLVNVQTVSSDNINPRVQTVTGAVKVRC